MAKISYLIFNSNKMDSFNQLCSYIGKKLFGEQVTPNTYYIFILRTLFQQFFGMCYPSEIIGLIFMILYEPIQIYAGFENVVLFRKNSYVRILGSYNEYAVQTLSPKNIKLISQGPYTIFISTLFSERTKSNEIHTLSDFYIPECIAGLKSGLPGIDVKSIYCSEDRAIVLSSGNKKCYGWGKNKYGQLGLGDTVKRSDLCVINLNDVESVSCSEYHTVALTSYHEVYVWGKNHHGQLGLGDETDRCLPQKLDLLNIKSIACGGFHTIAVTYSNEMYSWGYNHDGQLGLGDNNDRDTPCKIELIFDIKSVSCGRLHTMILTMHNKIYVCGNNMYGQLGLGFWTSLSISVPLEIILPGFPNVREVICGAYYTIAVTNSDIVYIWGQKFNGSMLNNCTPCEFKY